uniref:Uncharacterized protein n=1 Tax=Opuntia streptacantha TaxID=393608 RepID=A0A7C9B048_OPUST
MSFFLRIIITKCIIFSSSNYVISSLQIHKHSRIMHNNQDIIHTKYQNNEISPGAKCKLINMLIIPIFDHSNLSTWQNQRWFPLKPIHPHPPFPQKVTYT